MKRLLGTLIISLIVVGSQAQTEYSDYLAYENDTETNLKLSVKTNINNTLVDDILEIDIAETFSGRITVSIFNSIGEIVIEQMLRNGTNKVDVNTLLTGEYIAVVREDDIYKQKVSFEVK